MEVSRAPATSNNWLTVLFNSAALGAMGLGVCYRRSSIGIVSGRFRSVVCCEQSCADSVHNPPLCTTLGTEVRAAPDCKGGGGSVKRYRSTRPIIASSGRCGA